MEMTGNYRRIFQKQLTELQKYPELITDFFI